MSNVITLEKCGCMVDHGIPYRCPKHSLKGDRCPYGPLQLHTWEDGWCIHCGSRGAMNTLGERLPN